MTDAADELVCRICRGSPEEDGDPPLKFPCRCEGTVGAIHEECLSRWLRYSGKDTCELCKFKYQWEPLFAPGTPAALPRSQLVIALIKWLSAYLPTFLGGAFVVMLWGWSLPVVRVLLQPHFYDDNTASAACAASAISP